MKKTYSKILSVILALCCTWFAICLIGCTDKTSDNKDKNETRVLNEIEQMLVGESWGVIDTVSWNKPYVAKLVFYDDGICCGTGQGDKPYKFKQCGDFMGQPGEKYGLYYIICFDDEARYAFSPDDPDNLYSLVDDKNLIRRPR